jgi:hypothetical protein
MNTLSEIISRRIIPEQKDRNSPHNETLSAPIQGISEKPPALYEAVVFNYLLAKKDELGIKSVIKFTALLVDGAVELLDGKRLAVEIKFRMNWEKACQAGWQFRTFLKRTDRRPFCVDGGLVFFEEFSGDWQRRAQSRLLENGWNHWYTGHSEVDGLRLDLLRLRLPNEEIEPFPIGEDEVLRYSIKQAGDAATENPF